MKCLLFILSVLLSADVLSQQTTRVIIHFDFDKYNIRTADAAMLDSIFAANSQSSVKSIELYGHCDFIGDHAYNDALSSKRVEQTKAYLLAKGVSEDVFVKSEGFGKRRPLNENRSPEERFDNRRVELVINWQANPSDENSLSKLLQNSMPYQPALSQIIKDSTNVKAGTTIVLRNIQFIPGRHFLLPESQPTLDTLYQVMRDNPTLVIEIQGHVCCTPDNEDGYDLDLRTMDLSVQRAKAIYEHLIERNIAPSRLSYVGYGGSRKLYPLERNDFERQENRRVELRIVSR